jgi:hypothetical protein
MAKTIASNSKLMAELLKEIDANHTSTQTTLGKHGQALQELQMEQSRQRIEAASQQDDIDLLRKQVQELLDDRLEKQAAEVQQLERSIQQCAANAGRAISDPANQTINFFALKIRLSGVQQPGNHSNDEMRLKVQYTESTTG